MTMRSWLAAATVILLFETGPAAAAIRIIDSIYADGVTTVTGQTRPHQKVTLDGKYSAQSDGAGRFEFHVKYKPETCLSDIAAGEDSYSAVITNCLLGDATASDQAPSGN
jgi:hypothetical protein